MKIEELLKIIVEKDASDLHIKAGSPPSIRLSDGELVAIDEDVPPLTPDDTEYLIKPIMAEHDKQTFPELRRNFLNKTPLSFSIYKGRFFAIMNLTISDKASGDMELTMRKFNLRKS